MNILTFLLSKKKNDRPDQVPSTLDRGGIKQRSLFDFLAQNYIWILALAGFFILAEQLNEHKAGAWSVLQFSATFYWEILAVIGLLGLIGVLIRVLLTTIAEKTRTLNILKVKHDFIQKLSACQDIPEASKSLALQISVIIPSANIELYIHEHAKDWFIRVKHDDDQAAGHKDDTLPVGMETYPCQSCILNNSSTLHPLGACHRPDVRTNLDLDEQLGFCMPLVYGDSPVGLLLLYTPVGQPPNDEQTELLSHLSGEMSQAIGILIEKKTREEVRLTEKIHTAQLDIARDLHDTVGQNISYLRMRLDHLSERNDKSQSDLIMEIKSMSKVANESYDLVRGTLAMLQADDSVDLLYLFSRYSEQLTERSSFSIDFSTQGEARSLSSSRIRHLFYIFREALSNIEKHASASQVHVQIIWEENNLNLSISDNGKGYDLSRTQKIDTHYGLKFMRERAILLNGSLSIQSVPGTGTNIRVLIPCE